MLKKQFPQRSYNRSMSDPPANQFNPVHIYKDPF